MPASASLLVRGAGPSVPGYRDGVPAHYPDRRARQERLEAELREILPRIVDADTEKVILFGSAARGTPGSTSDLDLLIVRRDRRTPSERLDDLYRRARARVALDLVVYTPEELESALATSSFVRAALRDGKVIHERSRSLA